jgi:hypothetical protein
MGFLFSVLKPPGARSRVAIVLTAIAILFPWDALALDPNLTIKQLHHTAWGPGQGAAES